MGGAVAGVLRGEAHSFGGGGHGFGEVEEVRGAGASEGGEGVDHVFLCVEHDGAEALEEGGREGLVTGRCALTEGDGGCALTDLRGEVGHGADDGDGGAVAGEERADA